MHIPPFKNLRRPLLLLIPNLSRPSQFPIFFFFFPNLTASPSSRRPPPAAPPLQHLIYTWTANVFLGIRTYLMRVFKWVVAAGTGLHKRLAAEIRSVIQSTSKDGEITFVALEKMELTKSVVYEAFRIDPPVQAQYGRARKDLIVESHDAKYEVKKGEMICGFQPMATRDPKVFEKPEEFVAERFMGKGKELLKYVLWSNGPETEETKVDNKLCAAKEMGPFVGRLLLAVMFRRYDEIIGEVGKTMEEVDVTVTGLIKAGAKVNKV